MPLAYGLAGAVPLAHAWVKNGSIALRAPLLGYLISGGYFLSFYFLYEYRTSALSELDIFVVVPFLEAAVGWTGVFQVLPGVIGDFIFVHLYWALLCLFFTVVSTILVAVFSGIVYLLMMTYRIRLLEDRLADHRRLTMVTLSCAMIVGLITSQGGLMP